MDLKEIDSVNPNKHWYYLTKSYALNLKFSQYSLNAKVIADIGAGDGFFIKNLPINDIHSNLFCIDTNYLKDTNFNNISYIRDYNETDLEALLFIDVLEHVQNDVALLAEYVSKSKIGSYFYITVPAFQSLWSGHDVFLGHVKRYKLEDIVSTVEKAGLNVITAQYIFSFIFPLVLLKRKIRLRREIVVKSHLKEVGWFFNYILKVLCLLEHRFFVNKFFGLSCFVVGKNDIH
jgi:hypothetical protein